MLNSILLSKKLINFWSILLPVKPKIDVNFESCAVTLNLVKFNTYSQNMSSKCIRLKI